MAAPRGAEYTPRASRYWPGGITFYGREGTSEAYNRYQQERSRHLGFSGYAEEKAAARSPLLRSLIKETKAKGEDTVSFYREMAAIHHESGNFRWNGPLAKRLVKQGLRAKDWRFMVGETPNYTRIVAYNSKEQKEFYGPAVDNQGEWYETPTLPDIRDVIQRAREREARRGQ